MKKIATTLLAATMTATTLLAAPFSKSGATDRLEKRQSAPTAIATYPLTQDLPILSQKPLKAYSDEPITEAPEGDVKIYGRDADIYFVMFQDIVHDEELGFKEEIIYCDNGEVYFSNPVPGVYTDTYMKGTLDGDKIHVEFPQAIGYKTINDEERVIYAVKLIMDEFDPTNFETCDVEDQYADFVINADGTVTWEEAGLFIGVCINDNGSTGWLGSGAWNYYYDPFNNPTPVTPPASLEQQSWCMFNKAMPEVYLFSEMTPLSVCIDDSTNEMYLKGLFTDDNNTALWIKGSINGDKVTFLSDQYLGMDDMDRFMYFK